MGIFNWSKKPTADTVALATWLATSIESICSDFRQKHPLFDQHRILSSAYKVHMLGNVQVETTSLEAYGQTTIFACLHPPQSDRALALYICFQGNASAVAQMPGWSEEFAKLVEPVHTAQQQNNRNSLTQMYSKYNSFQDHEDIEIQKTVFEAFLDAPSHEPHNFP